MRFRRFDKSRSGYTFLELLVASALGSVLLGGMASAVYIASQAMDIDDGNAADKMANTRAIDQILRDVRHATAFTERTATAMTFAVPDRDGDGASETIRYAWAGSPGDPLTYELNGSSGEPLVTNVGVLDFGYITRLMTAPAIDGGTSAPTILFVSGQPADGDGGLGTPTAQEQLRIDLMNSWGYAVTVISDQASQTELDDELANSVMVYVSGQVGSASLGTKLNATDLGIVTESFGHAETLGFYNGATSSTANKQQIHITNATHYITNQHTTGTLSVVSSDQTMKWTTSATAPDAVKLADVDAALSYPTMLILDQNDTLADGSTAAGRRCQLPWGEGGFDTASLNADGQIIMQRAIEWATGLGDDTETVGVTFEEYTEQSESSFVTSVTIATPAGTTENDLLIAAIAMDGAQRTITPPAGWTLIAHEENSGRANLAVYSKLASNGEPADQSFSWSGGEEVYAWIMRFTGHDLVNPIHQSAVSNGSSSTPDCPAVTTSVANAMIVRIGGFNDDDITAGDAGMADHTTITMNESGSGSGTASGGAAHVMQSSAGDSGSANFTLTNSENFVTVTIAIAPETN